MSQADVANRYARAILEIGAESNQVGPLTEQIRNFARAYAESPELQSVLDNPLVDEAQRNAILADTAQRVGVSGVALNAVRLLASRKRLHALPDVARRLGTLADEKAGIVRASVTSAGPLPEAFYQRLTSELEAATNRKIELERHQDPSLIAGIVTRIGDNTIDGSVKGRLAEIERQLLNI
jgi:F-type H+-transporting ATPase subunit delta